MTPGAFLRWWGGELEALLPGPLRTAGRPHRDTLRLELEDSRLRALYAGAGQERELGHAPRDAAASLAPAVGRLHASRTGVVVLLPAGEALVRTVELPAAAEENLSEVLSFEMERLTPFRREDVYFTYRVCGRDRARQQIQVHLGVAPRAVVDPVLAAAPGWDLRPAPEAEDDWSPEAVPFTFLPSSYRRRNGSRVNRLLLVLNVLLLFAVVAVPMAQQHRRLERLHGAVERARAGAENAAELRNRLDRYARELRFITGKRTAQRPAVLVIEDLSRLLPDSTWLYRLEIRGDTVHMQGTAQAASSLISVLERSGMFHRVSFASPVTQDPASGRERFNLSAEIAADPAPQSPR